LDVKKHNYIVYMPYSFLLF